MAPPQSVLGFIIEIGGKYSNFLLQNHLPQMFEMRFVALPVGLLPSL